MSASRANINEEVHRRAGQITWALKGRWIINFSTEEQSHVDYNSLPKEHEQ